VLDPNHRPAIAGEHDRAVLASDLAKHAIHSTPLEPQLGQIAPREERIRVRQTIRGGWAGSHVSTRTLVRSPR